MKNLHHGKKRSRGIILSLLIFLNGCIDTQEKEILSVPITVYGTIYDARSLLPLSNVEVKGAKETAKSNLQGQYSIELPVGVRKLSFALGEYQSVYKVVIADSEHSKVLLDVYLPPKGMKIEERVILVMRNKGFDSMGNKMSTDFPVRANIWLLDELGNNDLPVPVEPDWADERCPRWSPDHQFIAFCRNVTGNSASSRKARGLFLIKIPEKTIRKISPDIFVEYLDWSPDGKKIVAANQKEIFIFNNLQKITPTYKTIYTCAHTHPSPSIWSIHWVKNEWIYFTLLESIPIKGERNRFVPKRKIMAIKSDGTSLHDWMSDSVFSFGYPFATPDGQKIFYGRFGEGNDFFPSLWSANSDGTQKKRILEHGAVTVGISDDGRKLRYIYHGLKEINLENIEKERLIAVSVEDADF